LEKSLDRITKGVTARKRWWICNFLYQYVFIWLSIISN